MIPSVSLTVNSAAPVRNRRWWPSALYSETQTSNGLFLHPMEYPITDHRAEGMRQRGWTTSSSKPVNRGTMGISLSVTRFRSWWPTAAGLALSAVLLSCGQPSSQGDDMTAHEVLNTPSRPSRRCRATSYLGGAPAQAPTVPAGGNQRRSDDAGTDGRWRWLACGRYRRTTRATPAPGRLALPGGHHRDHGSGHPGCRRICTRDLNRQLAVECPGASSSHETRGSRRRRRTAPTSWWTWVIHVLSMFR